MAATLEVLRLRHAHEWQRFRACGGPGSGVPGPCPEEGGTESGSQDAAEEIPENQYGDRLDKSQSEIINTAMEGREEATDRMADEAEQLIEEVESTDFDEDEEAEQRMIDGSRDSTDFEAEQVEQSVDEAVDDIVQDVADNYGIETDDEVAAEDTFRDESGKATLEYVNTLEQVHTDRVDYIERAATGEDPANEKTYVEREAVRDKMDDAAHDLRINLAAAAERFLARIINGKA